MPDGADVEQLAEATAALVRDLHRVVESLESLHVGRKFTPDGHLVGSLGEVAALALFDITLYTASTKGCDGIAADGRTVEIKATYGTAGIGVRRSSQGIADALIVLKLSKDGSVEVVYDGPYATAHTLIAHKPDTSNGQVSMSLTRLRALNETVLDGERIAGRQEES